MYVYVYIYIYSHSFSLSLPPSLLPFGFCWHAYLLEMCVSTLVCAPVCVWTHICSSMCVDVYRRAVREVTGCVSGLCGWVGTGWRRLIGCLQLQVIFRKRATNYRALLRKMTYEDKPSNACIDCLLCDLWYISKRNFCDIFQSENFVISEGGEDPCDALSL